MSAGSAEGSAAAAETARANFERAAGEVLMFLSAFPPYNEMFMKDIALILTPLALKQYQLTRTKEGLIIGFRSWAMVTEELAARLRENPDAAGDLKREDWKSGECKVIISEAGLCAEKRDSSA